MAPVTTFISDVATVQANGVHVMFINSNKRIADMETAQLMFIEPLLGSTLYDAVLEDMNNQGGVYDGLLIKIRKALAPLAYWLDLPNLQMQITDMGAATFEAKNMTAAHRWEFNEVREALAVKGCFALEKLIENLYAKKEDYNWTAPDEYNYTFTTGIDFAKYYPLFQPYRTFESLRSLMKQVEDQFIIPTIGAAFFESLRDSTNPDANEKTAIGYLKNAVANLTIKRACEVLPVRISDKGFTVYLQTSTEDVRPAEASARNSQTGKLEESVEQTGETYLARLSSFLNLTASAQLFPLYFNSTYYKPVVNPTDIPDKNETRNFFSMP